MEGDGNHSKNWLNLLVTYLTKEALVRIIEMFNYKHNKSLIRKARRSAKRTTIAAMLENNGFWEVFQFTSAQLAASVFMMRAIAKVSVREKKLMAAVDKCVAG